MDFIEPLQRKSTFLSYSCNQCLYFVKLYSLNKNPNHFIYNKLNQHHKNIHQRMDEERYQRSAQFQFILFSLIMLSLIPCILIDENQAELLELWNGFYHFGSFLNVLQL